jgi:hypothetical protein
MAGEYYIELRVIGVKTVPLGHVYGPEALPELLRHVADYWTENPAECAAAFDGDPRRGVPRNVAFPFSSPYVAIDNANYFAD